MVLLSLQAAIRVTAGSCVALLLAGVGGAVADGGSRSPVRPSGPTPTIDVPSSTGSPSTGVTSGGTAPGGGGSSPAAATDAAALQTDLLVANDLGGYYTSIPSDSGPRLATSGCLAGLGLPADGKVRAVQYLRGPFDDQLPDINEQLTSYPTATQAAKVYGTLHQVLAGCRSTTLSLSDGAATATLAPLAVPGIGDEGSGDQATTVQGGFSLGSLTGRATVSVVQEATTILVFVFADRQPPSLAILGSQVSTLRAAVGKASP